MQYQFHYSQYIIKYLSRFIVNKSYTDKLSLVCHVELAKSNLRLTFTMNFQMCQQSMPAENIHFYSLISCAQNTFPACFLYEFC